MPLIWCKAVIWCAILSFPWQIDIPKWHLEGSPHNVHDYSDIMTEQVPNSRKVWMIGILG